MVGMCDWLCRRLCVSASLRVIRSARIPGIVLPVTCGIAVGDGANDLSMISAAGLGIAFKAAVCIAADTSLSMPHLDAILDLLAISREDVEAAGAKPALPDDGRIVRLADD